jgi:hypothetical protein
MPGVLRLDSPKELLSKAQARGKRHPTAGGKLWGQGQEALGEEVFVCRTRCDNTFFASDFNANLRRVIRGGPYLLATQCAVAIWARAQREPVIVAPGVRPRLPGHLPSFSASTRMEILHPARQPFANFKETPSQTTACQKTRRDKSPAAVHRAPAPIWRPGPKPPPCPAASGSTLFYAGGFDDLAKGHEVITLRRRFKG